MASLLHSDVHMSGIHLLLPVLGVQLLRQVLSGLRYRLYVSEDTLHPWVVDIPQVQSVEVDLLLLLHGTDQHDPTVCQLFQDQQVEVEGQLGVEGRTQLRHGL